MTVYVPEKAEDWPFEAKAFAISEANDAVEIRREIDSLAGIPEPNWDGDQKSAQFFSKSELTLLLLALGGPQ